LGLLQCPAFAPIFCPELLLVDARDYLARCPETWLVESRYRLPEFLNRCSACLSLHRRHCRCCGIPRVALRFVSRSNIIRCTWIALTLAIEHEHRLKCRAHSCLSFRIAGGIIAPPWDGCPCPFALFCCSVRRSICIAMAHAVGPRMLAFML
jgi:hypothetical protein